MTNQKYSFIFICQKGDLEIKSLFLALSLKKYLKVNYELIAVIPEMYNRVELPSESTLNILKKNNIRIEIIKNTFCNNSNNYITGDKISNKIFCFNIAVDSDKIIFLDSDMLCISPFVNNNIFSDYNFIAKQVDVSNVRSWEKIYKIFNIEMPTQLIPCTVDNFLLPPYFNAGFIAINKSSAKQLYFAWLDFFYKLSEPHIIEEQLFNPVNRDQVSLAIAVQKLKLNCYITDEFYNYPIRIKSFSKNNYPCFAHYHDSLTIFKNKILLDLVKEFINEYSEIKILIKDNKLWNNVFYCTKLKRNLTLLKHNFKYKFKRRVIQIRKS